MLEHQVEVNVKDDHEDTPLIMAVAGPPGRGDRLPLVQLLCQHQADVSVENKSGKDVLCLAEEKDMAHVVAFLKGMCWCVGGKSGRKNRHALAISLHLL